MIDKVDIATWGGLVAGVLAVLGGIWNRIGIKSLNVKTDGMMEYRSRADRAEGALQEQSDVRDRAAQKERDDK
jgi:hypothetical protein